MALPTSGQLTFSEIYAEVYGSWTTQQCSMFAMATSAGISTSNVGVSSFYGYSAGVTASWSNLGTPYTSSTWFQQWRWISLEGLGAATVKTYITNYYQGGTAATASMYWYHDTDSSPPGGATAGTSVGSRSTVGNTSYYVPTSTYTSSSNYLMVKIYISKAASGGCSGFFRITTTYQVVTGTISSYTVSPTADWTYSF